METARTALLGRIGAWAIRALGATWRVRVEGRDAMPAASLGAVWHHGLLIGAHFFRDRGVAICVSRSRDGDRIAAVLRRLGYAEPLRGSSSRGGPVVLRQLARTLQSGVTVGMLSDGPRGPARRSKIGVVSLARLTGVPITPIAMSARPRLRLRSWDRALLPAPFACVVLRFGDPIAVPWDADPEREERLRRDLDRALERLTAARSGRFDPRTRGGA